MQAQGKLIGVSRNIITGGYNIAFEVAQLPSDLEEITGCDALDITAQRHREKRSLNANAYYWQLLGKLSAVLKEDCAVLHNRYLRQHPVFTGWYAEIPDTDEDAMAADRSMTYHVMPTSKVRDGKYGTNYRTYAIIKGSHEYDTKEMSVLIDALVEDCKDQGIETLSPDQLERIKAAWHATK